MGLIRQKEEDKDLLFGNFEIIGRGEGPDGIEVSQIELHDGLTAQDISGTTAARNADIETEADPELMDGAQS